MLAAKIKEKKAFPHWNVTEQEYNHIFDEIIESQKQKCLLDLKKENIVRLIQLILFFIQKLLKESIENCLTNSLNNYKKNFWNDFNKAYLECLTAKFRSLENYLIETFKLTKEESNEILSSIQNELYDSTKKAWKTQIRDKLDVVKDLFKKRFWYEENGEVRNWNRYEEEEIDNLFKSTRADYIDIFENFKSFNVVKNLIDLIYIDNEEEIVSTIDGRLKSEKFDILLNKNEISNLRKIFENAIAQNLEDAKRRKVGLGLMNLPIWFYGLLAIFGWDDIFRLVSSKIGMAVALVLGSVLFVLKKLGKLNILKDCYFDLEENVAKIQKRVNTFFKKLFHRY